VSRREQIKMSEREVASFLAQERTLTCASNGVRGWPHLMPLWYVLREVPGGGPPPVPRLWAWTYAASQKVRNLERDARATVQVEAGELYQELRGVMLECEVQIHRDLATVAALGNEILRRQSAIAAGADWPAVPGGEPPAAELAGEVADELAGEVAAMVETQAAKRVALEFVERRRTSWDHRKLGGVY
jgi:hypothetical protein